jgi:sugar phosphate isomerase/epimerase
MNATISLQLYTIREALEADPRAALARVAELGFTTVELFGMDTRVDAYAAGLAETGLRAASAHATLVGRGGVAAPDFGATFDLAERLGVGTVIEPSTPAASWKDGAEIERMADELNGAAEAAAERGLRVGYHNHDGELRGRVGSVSGLEYFTTLLDPRVVLEVDAYWVVAGGEDLVPFLERTADRVRLLHVKDGKLEGDLASQPAAGTGETPDHLATQVPAGTGAVPLDAALAALPDLEFAVVEFDVYSGDLFAGITAGRDYLIERGYGA